MDDFIDVLEVQRSERDGEDFYPHSEQLTVEDLHLLRLDDLQKVEEILQLYIETNVPRDDIELFKIHLLQRVDTWFVEVADVGLIYLTDVIPTFSANLKVIFWDRKFGKERRELVQRVLATAFNQFYLKRVQSLVPTTNRPLAETEMKKIGFIQEGLCRKAWREGGVDYDLYIFSLLKNEVKWETVAHLAVG